MEKIQSDLDRQTSITWSQLYPVEKDGRKDWFLTAKEVDLQGIKLNFLLGKNKKNTVYVKLISGF
jgi:hypothetical protein